MRTTHCIEAFSLPFLSLLRRTKITKLMKFDKCILGSLSRVLLKRTRIMVLVMLGRVSDFVTVLASLILGLAF
jgi:hypothetical protein